MVLASGLLLWATSVHAAELSAKVSPISAQSHAAIDTPFVRVERYIPEATWLARVGELNPEVSQDLNLVPVSVITVTRLYEDQDIRFLDEVMEFAQKSAAEIGANLVYVDKELRWGGELHGIQFVAYRVEYKERLIPPELFVALPEVSVGVTFFEEQVRAWEDRHFGRVAVAFGPHENYRKSVMQLGKLHAGAPVRVVLRDGSSMRGVVSGLDEENNFWIHPKGLAGLFRDHAVPAIDIRSVALLHS